MSHPRDTPPAQPVKRVPAAQYLRMSTEHQQYSSDNQAAAIHGYAEKNGFEIVATYTDDGKSGVTIKGRRGLLQLIDDVDSRRSDFAAILVYDVSRWGRFQNPDEAAVYEFRCRWAGVPVHYCAEQFENDGSVLSSLMKTLKRAMAAEYSRELSIKVSEGHIRMLARGYHQGGFPRFGLQRVLIDAEGNKKQVLRHGERKNIQSDRVILEPGPPEQVAIVGEVYRRYLAGEQQSSLVAALNKRGDYQANGRPWTEGSMRRMLTSECYIGNIVWGKLDGKLARSRQKVPKSHWVRREAAFAPVVEPSLFWEVQDELSRRRSPYSTIDMLDGLKRLLKKHGTLNKTLIDEARGVASTPSICRRFGSLNAAYAKVGFQSVPNNKYTKINKRIAAIGSKLGSDIGGRLGGGFQVESMGLAFRLYRDNTNIVLLLARYIDRLSGPEQWYFDWNKLTSASFAVIGTMDRRNKKVSGYFVVAGSDLQSLNLRKIRDDKSNLKPFQQLDLSSCISEVAQQLKMQRSIKECPIESAAMS